MAMSSSTASCGSLRSANATINAVTADHPLILVVDDDQGVTDTFSKMLRLEGFVVHTAGNAEMGLEEARAHPPDAIILDWRMPLMDGLQFLRRLRATDCQRTTPVAIVTGEWALDDATSSELRALGVNVKFKPLWQEELADLARSLVKVTH